MHLKNVGIGMRLLNTCPLNTAHFPSLQGLAYLSPEHMGYLHAMVVHHAGQVVGRVAISLQQNLIIQRIVWEFYYTVHLVLDNSRALGRNL